MGDLIATCTSRHSRNRRAGEMIARGLPADAVEREIGQVVEGLATVRALLVRAAAAVTAKEGAAVRGTETAVPLEQ